eukprot:6149020-Alexandrium_andersonii.AAC.1
MPGKTEGRDHAAAWHCMRTRQAPPTTLFARVATGGGTGRRDAGKPTPGRQSPAQECPTCPLPRPPC